MGRLLRQASRVSPKAVCFSQEYRNSRLRLPHLPAESTASLSKEKRISQAGVPYLVTKSLELFKVIYDIVGIF
jgi:hypothetical protein